MIDTKLLCIKDNLQSTYFGVSIDTIFATITTISVFVIGIIANIIINRRRERNRLIHIKKYFLNVLNKFLGPIEKQINSYKDLSSSISNILSRNYNFNINSDLIFDPLTNIDKLDLFKIFVYSSKQDEMDKQVAHYSNIIGSIEFIKN